MIPFANFPAIKNNVKRYATSNPDGTKTVTFEHGSITIRMTCNEPSTAALESSRAVLYEILSRIIDRDVPCAVLNHSENASILNR